VLCVVRDSAAGRLTQSNAARRCVGWASALARSVGALSSDGDGVKASWVFSRWTAHEALCFWLTDAALGSLAAEGVPYCGAARMALSLATFTPVGGDLSARVAKSVVGKLLGALGPVAEATRDTLRSMLRMASSLLRSVLSVLMESVIDSIEPPSADPAVRETAQRCREDARHVAALRRHTDLRALIRPLTRSLTGVSEAETLTRVTMELLEEEEEDGRLVHCDWDAPAVPDGPRPIASTGEGALGFVSPQAAALKARRTLTARWGHGANFVSPQDDARGGGRSRVSVATFGTVAAGLS
jgi:hypothetical protein